MWEAINRIHEQGYLQDELNTVYLWAENNNMTFNGDKFVGIRFASDDKKFPYTTPEGTPIELKDKIKDLGIIMETNLKFNTHIKKHHSESISHSGLVTENL